jgi:outer membrane protein assembly factor BamB
MLAALYLPILFITLVDWPQFRGAQSNGHAGGVNTPIKWSETENVVWKVEIPGLGWSSPVIASEQVFLTTAVEVNGQLSLRAIALRTDTGEVQWESELRRLAEVPSIHSKNSHASPTPIVDGERVYVHFGTWGTYALSIEDGSLEWSSHELVYSPVHGNGGSPVLHDGKLVIVCDGSSDPFVAALDAATGKVAWKTERSIKPPISHSFATVNVVDVNGQSQVLAPGPGHFAAYDLHSGEELWRIVEPGWSVVPQPIVGHGLVIYNHDYDHPELIAARLGGSGDVTDSHIVWRIRRQAPSTPTPLLIGEELYFVSDAGIATCVNALTGQTYWTERVKGNYSASPVHANGLILFLSEDGVATWIQPGRRYEKVATCELPGRTFATPAFVGDAMYLRTNTHLYKFSER